MRDKNEIIPSRYNDFMTVLHIRSNDSSRGSTSEHWSFMISVNDYNVHRSQRIRIADPSFLKSAAASLHTTGHKSPLPT